MNNLTFKSSEEIKLPYININSDDAKEVNEEIKQLAEKAYADFGKPLIITNVQTNQVTTDNNSFSYTKCGYEKYINNNILSVVITEMSITVPGDGSTSYRTYNFDLESLKLVNVADVLQKYNFRSQADFNNKLQIELKNLEAKGEAVSYGYTEWDGERFFIKDNKINVVVPSLAMGEYFFEVDSNAVEINNGNESTSYSEQNINYTSNPKDQNSRTDFSFMSQLKNTVYESERKNGEYYYKVEFDENSYPTITVEYIAQEGNNMYGTFSEFSNIMQDTAAGSVYVIFNYKDLNGTGPEKNVQIKYSNVTDNDSIYLQLSAINDKEVELKKIK